jgi:hypothetical protein
VSVLHLSSLEGQVVADVRHGMTTVDGVACEWVELTTAGGATFRLEAAAVPCRGVELRDALVSVELLGTRARRSDPATMEIPY